MTIIDDWWLDISIRDLFIDIYTWALGHTCGTIVSYCIGYNAPKGGKYVQVFGSYSQYFRIMKHHPRSYQCTNFSQAVQYSTVWSLSI